MPGAFFHRDKTIVFVSSCFPPPATFPVTLALPSCLQNPQKAELQSKDLRDAARLEASRRAKHEAEMKVREQNAQRQAEVERRREQERVEREARETQERHEREARRKAVLEAKAKAAQEVRTM